MKTYTLIGDIHGDINYKYLMTPGSIQLGDLDLYGYDNFSFEDGKRYFIAGNHDNWLKIPIKLHEVAKNLISIPRGYISGKVLFISGADSIDKHSRIPAVSWHYQEQITEKEIKNIINNGKNIEAVISHDFPEFCYKFDYGIIEHRIGLSKIFGALRPQLWIGAHHHVSKDFNLHDCRFVTLNINETRDFVLPMEKID